MTDQTIPKITKSVVINARNTIKERGLGRGAYENAEGCVCTYGAFCRALRPDQPAWDTIDDLMPHIRYPVARLFGERDSFGIYTWNDTTDERDVLAKFDQVIASMPEEQTQ